MTAADTCLVADIGGTKARLALVDQPSGTEGLRRMRGRSVLRCADYSGLEGVLEVYLGQIAPFRPRRACLAVAGPVGGDRVPAGGRFRAKADTPDSHR